jgi:predicted transcriptional regulator
MEIDMTCIDLSVEDLLRCSFGLSEREVAVLLRLLEGGGWLPISRISSLSRRDRSVVQRALASLMAKGIVERDQHNLAGGGYEFLYRARDKPMIKRLIIGKSRAFSAMVRESVEGW